MSRVVSSIESDLAAIRAFTPKVDVERGAARFAAATVSLGAVATGALAPAQLKSGAVTLKSLSFAPSLLGEAARLYCVIEPGHRGRSATFERGRSLAPRAMRAA
jgi:hypothetical protein